MGSTHKDVAFLSSTHYILICFLLAIKKSIIGGKGN